MGALGWSSAGAAINRSILSGSAFILNGATTQKADDALANSVNVTVFNALSAGRKNIVYNFDVTKALQVSIGCRHFQSGILSFKKDLKIYKITYDKTLISGCDNFADIEYEGTTETINLVL
jgi:hypothetical protein